MNGGCSGPEAGWYLLGYEKAGWFLNPNSNFYKQFK